MLNGKWLYLATAIFCVRSVVLGAVIEVPGGAARIEQAVQRAGAGDTILIAPGTYRLNLTIADKAVTLASRFLTTGDTSFVRRTVLDGDGETVLNFEAVAEGSAVIGLTVSNGDDGIMPACRMLISDCHFENNGDAIDYEGGGGVCRNNSFTGNGDDAIDLDGPVSVEIVGNRIWANGDDGIEIRLHPYDGPLLKTLILGNTIHGNGEDGIQFIDYGTDSPREFTIERNNITANAMAAVGCMGAENTVENYEAFPVPEKIVLLNNTIAGNNYGVTGGARMTLVNNLIVSTTRIAAKGISGRSLIASNLFWGNGRDMDGCTAGSQDNLFCDPLLTGEYRLMAGSPAIGAGAKLLDWNGEKVRAGTYGPGETNGMNIGAY